MVNPLANNVYANLIDRNIKLMENNFQHHNFREILVAWEFFSLFLFNQSHVLCCLKSLNWNAERNIS